MDIDKEILQKVRPFTAMGVSFSKVEGKQVIGYCPFSDKSNKFYVNYTNLLWDSKSAGTSGSLKKFLRLICKQNRKEMPAKQIARIARDRNLPEEAFEGKELGLGHDGLYFTMPVLDAKGEVCDVRRWKPKKAVQSLPGLRTFLFGGHTLVDQDRIREPVYICEGEWDVIALRWLLKKLDKPGVVVGSPGAGTFKLEWSNLFDRREVVVCYDNDEAGREGAQKVANRLASAAKKVEHIWWPEDAPDGYDVRDWIVYGALVKEVPKKCLFRFLSLAKSKVRPIGGGEEEEETEAPKKRRRRVRGGHRALYASFSKWLQMDDEEALSVVMATILANRIEGDPLWLLLIAPPGGMKSELLMSLLEVPETYHVSSLTPHALVSGMNLSGGQDPSLMPKINGKSLVIKDFTAILSLHPTARDEIFGQLRDAYDGHFEKLFGNGVLRRYKSKFSIIAGVTPAVDAYASMHSGLGERFLKYRMFAGTEKEEFERILRAMGNTGKENAMREALQEAAEGFLESASDRVPPLERGLDRDIAQLGMLVARLRGSVNRDKYSRDLMHNKAGFEIGTRLAKQLTKLGKGIAMYYGKAEVDQPIMRTIVSVALASVPDKVEEVVRTLREMTKNKDPDSFGPTTKELAAKCRGISRATVFRVLQDLEMLDLVKREMGRTAYWSFTPAFGRLVEGAGAFEKLTRSFKYRKRRKCVVRRKK